MGPGVKNKALRPQEIEWPEGKRYNHSESASAAPLLKRTVSILDHVDGLAGPVKEYLASSQSFRLCRAYASVGEALSGIVVAPRDVVLVDLGSPNAEAAEFTQRLKRLRPKLTTVIAAAQADLGSWVRALQAGTDGLFVKPARKNRSRTLCKMRLLIGSHSPGKFKGSWSSASLTLAFLLATPTGLPLPNRKCWR